MRSFGFYDIFTSVKHYNDAKVPGVDFEPGSQSVEDQYEVKNEPIRTESEEVERSDNAPAAVDDADRDQFVAYSPQNSSQEVTADDADGQNNGENGEEARETDRDELMKSLLNKIGSNRLGLHLQDYILPLLNAAYVNETKWRDRFTDPQYAETQNESREAIRYLNRTKESGKQRKGEKAKAIGADDLDNASKKATHSSERKTLTREEQYTNSEELADNNAFGARIYMPSMSSPITGDKVNAEIAIASNGVDLTSNRGKKRSLKKQKSLTPLQDYHSLSDSIKKAFHIDAVDVAFDASSIIARIHPFALSPSSRDTQSVSSKNSNDGVVLRTRNRARLENDRGERPKRQTFSRRQKDRSNRAFLTSREDNSDSSASPELALFEKVPHDFYSLLDWDSSRLHSLSPANSHDEEPFNHADERDEEQRALQRMNYPRRSNVDSRTTNNRKFTLPRFPRLPSLPRAAERVLSSEENWRRKQRKMSRTKNRKKPKTSTSSGNDNSIMKNVTEFDGEIKNSEIDISAKRINASLLPRHRSRTMVKEIESKPSISSDITRSKAAIATAAATAASLVANNETKRVERSDTITDKVDVNPRSIPRKKFWEQMKTSNCVYNFCSDDKTYPYNSIRKAFESISPDLLLNLKTVNKNAKTQFSGDKIAEDTLNTSCSSIAASIKPLRAQNVYGVWKNVVNLPLIVDQTVVINECATYLLEALPETNADAVVLNAQSTTMLDSINNDANEEQQRYAIIASKSSEQLIEDYEEQENWIDFSTESFAPIVYSPSGEAIIVDADAYSRGLLSTFRVKPFRSESLHLHSTSVSKPEAAANNEIRAIKRKSFAPVFVSHKDDYAHRFAAAERNTLKSTSKHNHQQQRKQKKLKEQQRMISIMRKERPQNVNSIIKSIEKDRRTARNNSRRKDHSRERLNGLQVHYANSMKRERKKKKDAMEPKKKSGGKRDINAIRQKDELAYEEDALMRDADYENFIYYRYNPNQVPICAKGSNFTFCVEDNEYPVETIQIAIDEHADIINHIMPDVTEVNEYLVDGVNKDEDEKFNWRHYFTRRLHDYLKYANHSNSSGGTKYATQSFATQEIIGLKPDYYKEGGYICPSTVNYIQPRRAMNTEGLWKVIVNLRERYKGKEFKQYVRIER
ncbi:uncharacterized protein B4U79_17488, partial [Dinothrombium tinctorium]